jgi:hypothetical protein
MKWRDAIKAVRESPVVFGQVLFTHDEGEYVQISKAEAIQMIKKLRKQAIDDGIEPDFRVRVDPADKAVFIA